MSFTQAQLDALDVAIASGTLRVTYDGKTIEYRSMADLRTARRLVAEGVATATSGAAPTFVNPVFDRGV